MNQKFYLKICVLFFSSLTLAASAAPQSVRWTGSEDSNAELSHVLEVIKAKTGIELSTTDFTLIEDRVMATSHYTMLAQTTAGVPVDGQSLRLWTSLQNGDAIQVEARIDKPVVKPATVADGMRHRLTSPDTMAIVKRAIEQQGEDNFIRKIDWKDIWKNGVLVRVVKVKAKHGTHTVTLSLSTQQVIENTYSEFPQADQVSEFSIPVQVYPVYQEAQGQVLPRIQSELRYLNTRVHRPSEDPFTPMRSKHYQDDKQDPLLGLTVAGRNAGFWAMTYLKAQAKALVDATPFVDNSFTNGVILDGRYATVSLYPDAPTFFKPLAFTPQLSAQFFQAYAPMAGNPDHEEMLPGAAFLGRPITSSDDAWSRLARRLPDNDPATYINDGFDELQVYWAVTQLFDSLHAMGFTDPDLSTRPFHAFLYDSDISSRDNAFYTDDTINFTTYSNKTPNMARDNSTIWHELGHGVMDRLMGDEIRLADTGGLSEGMADFVAQLVINEVTSGSPYPGRESERIFNTTGFALTNEVHDDGESYGGAMNDLLRASMSHFGRPGLVKVADLTLETMRLTRNNPGLTANDWFSHMLFADSLGSANRAPGELSGLIMKSLNGRNFVFGDATPAKFTLKKGTDEVTSTGPGSRNNPIPLTLAADDKASYTLTASLSSSAAYKFKYPVTVKVELVKGPLQGAIHWVGEENSPLLFQINSEADAVSIPLTALGKCDMANRPDGSCVDFAYVQIWNNGETQHPQAKKRFYLRIHTKP